MRVSCRIECIADGRHHAVEHAGRSDHIRSCLCLRDRNLLHESKRRIIIEFKAAAGLFDDSAVPVGSILAGTEVGDDHKFWLCSLHGRDRFLDDTVASKRLRSRGVLFLRDTEENNGPHPFGKQLAGKISCGRERIANLSGHGRDWNLLFCCFVKEEREAECFGRKSGLGENRTENIASQTA